MQGKSGTLDFKVLGPIEVIRDGEPLPLRSIVQRRLLAALLAGSDQPVPVDVLEEAVWEGSAPEQSRKSLLVYLHRLRRSLAEERRIVRESSGYRIRVGEEDFDAKAFDVLASRAREARGRGRVEESATGFANAMRLWRGEPYEDVPSVGPIAAEAHRLGEDRLLAQQELLEVNLDMGMHASLIGDLEALVRAHPFRERLTALRMLALYRAGRQAEALQAFRESRKVLGEELGIDPGPLLQRVHHAILHRDERLESVATESIEGTWIALPGPPVELGERRSATPRELPADVAGFAGRDGELRFLEGARLGDADDGIPPAPIVVISGMAGVGKTASAVHWAHLVAGDYPDGQLFLNLRGFSAVPALRPIEALTAMLRSLGLAEEQVPAETDQAAALLRTETAGKRLLLLLDNAASAEQVAPLLPGSPGSLVIVTSRNQLGDLLARRGGYLLNQAPLAHDEAVELLKALLRVARSSQDPEIDELARRCGYLPLALRIAAANLADRADLGIGGFTERLSSGGQVEALRIGDSPHTAMRATFDGSYMALPEEARHVFRFLGIAPVRTLTVDSVAVLADTSRAVAERAVEQLVNAHMVIRGGRGRLHLHDLLRDYANDLLEPTDRARTAAMGRLLEWYLATADAACRSRYPGSARLLETTAVSALDDPEEALRWLEDERENLIALARHSGDRREDSVAWRLADILRSHAWAQLSCADFLALALAALRSARSVGSARGEAVAELCLSTVYLKARDFRKVVPHAERAITLSRRIGWDAGRASAHHNMMFACWQIGRLRTSVEHGEAALTMNLANGRRRAQSVNLAALGVVHGALGDLHKELLLHTEALGIAEEIGNARLQTAHLNDLAQTSIDLGSLAAAEDYAVRAMKLEADRGEGELGAPTAESMTALCSALGEYDNALAYAEAVVRQGREQGDRKRTADGLIWLALALNRLERHEEAVDTATHGLRVAEEDLAATTIKALVERAAGRIGLGAFNAARADARRALALAREGGYRIAEGSALNLMAEVHLRRGRTRRAGEIARRALDLLRPTGHRAAVSCSLWILGAAAFERGDAAAAKGHWRQARQLYEAMGAPMPKKYTMDLY
ncbi:AfsR/SARP family transcriptional regulator [Glycomyces paridis]|nr:BTAD domain-containing putative transcriptional regulator [Glycomyces paridis]